MPYLVVQHEQQGALHIDIPGTLHLEAVGLLGRGHPVPLRGTMGTLLRTGPWNQPCQQGLCRQSRAGALGWHSHPAWGTPGSS